MHVSCRLLSSLFIFSSLPFPFEPSPPWGRGQGEGVVPLHKTPSCKLKILVRRFASRCSIDPLTLPSPPRGRGFLLWGRGRSFTPSPPPRPPRPARSAPVPGR